jgi:cyclase
MINSFRIIPSVVIENKRCIKTKKFRFKKYIGDPINICNIFNSKNIKEIFIVDKSDRLDYNFLRRVFNQLFVPITFGGKISSINMVDKLFDTGVDKVSISSNSHDYDLIQNIVKKYGNQAISISLDFYKDNNSQLILRSNSNEVISGFGIKNHLNILNSIGVGDIVFRNFEHDGMRNGVDLSFFHLLPNDYNFPLLVGCGINSYEDIEKLKLDERISGVIISNLFSIYGKYESVLINYRY